MSRGATPFPAEGFQKLLEAEALRDGLALLDPALVALSRYLAELDAWRQRINLTGDLAPEELAAHALESAAGAPLIDDGAQVIDIGSGGGFPGVPLAIVRADLKVTPLEPRRKRAAFLRHVSRSVPVPNVLVLEDRVENLVADEWTVATTRALGDLAELIGTAPFLKEGGLLLAWTTTPAKLAEELNGIFRLERVVPLRGSERRLVGAYRKDKTLLPPI